MVDDSWKEGVRVRLAPDRLVVVTSARSAAGMLLNDWPGTTNSRKHRAARITILKVLEGTKRASMEDLRAARQAFVAVVEEAGLSAEPKSAD